MNKRLPERPQTMGKVPPQAVELEDAVLGAIMLEKDAINEVVDILNPESFYKNQNELIYLAILELYTKNEPIDLLTVTNQLRRSGLLEQAGGALYITELTSGVSSSAHIEHHARVISEMEMKRKIIAICNEGVRDGFDDTTDVFEIIDKLGSGVINLGSSNVKKSIFMKDLLPDVIREIEQSALAKDGVTGVTSGLYELDKITGGWQKSDLIIIAARPSMGKSDVAINFCLNAALDNKKVVFFNLEMSAVQIGKRALAIHRRVERGKIKTGKLSVEDWGSVSKFSDKISKNLIIQDNPTVSTIQFMSICRTLKMKEKIELIVVDYLQLIAPTSKGTTNDKVGEVSRTLKLIAKDLDIPVIALSQLSRDVEKRTGNKHPTLSDLRDSGSIEQDADIVAFPFRPEYYGIESREDGSSTFQLMELDIAKHRNGAVGSIDLRYLGKYGAITDWNTVTVPEIKHPEQLVYNPDKFHSSGLSDFDPAPF